MNVNLNVVMVETDLGMGDIQWSKYSKFAGEIAQILAGDANCASEIAGFLGPE